MNKSQVGLFVAPHFRLAFVVLIGDVIFLVDINNMDNLKKWILVALNQFGGPLNHK